MTEQYDEDDGQRTARLVISEEDRARLSAGLDKLRGEVAVAQELWQACKTFGMAAAYPEGRLHRAVADGLMTAKMVALMVEVGTIRGGVKASEAGRRGGEARAAKMIEEKQLVYDCWVEWQKEPSRYKSQAAFVRDMLEKCESVTSNETVARWCRVWKKAATEALQ